jgi:hypothetical protein
MNKTTVVFHSADLDGLLCEQIARKFLGNYAAYIGWNFGDPPLEIPSEGVIYVMDLPVDRVFGLTFGEEGHLPFLERTIWIDHHASSISTHNPTIPGYRIDGVAACRLAWQWFYLHIERGTAMSCMPSIDEFKDRELIEPTAVMLAGEYDIFDRKRMKEDFRILALQTGMKAIPLTDGIWDELLEPNNFANLLGEIIDRGEIVLYARTKEYEDVISDQGFDVEFEGVKFLACCSHECDIRSQLFEAGIKPHHEALLGFTFTGKAWRVSMYQIEGKEHVDVLSIAQRIGKNINPATGEEYGGGGHKGACGFMTGNLPFLCLGNQTSNPATPTN